MAATGEEVLRLLAPQAWAMVYSRIRGVFPPLDAPERIAGLVAETGAQEVLVTTSTYDREALSASYRGLARAVGLRPPTG